MFVQTENISHNSQCGCMKMIKCTKHHYLYSMWILWITSKMQYMY